MFPEEFLAKGLFLLASFFQMLLRGRAVFQVVHVPAASVNALVRVKGDRPEQPETIRIMPVVILLRVIGEGQTRLLAFSLLPSHKAT
jgi:hypothetical protein